ncbi:hypothetical protein HNQ57_002832 [Zhongshania antarctica]|uniref:Uncharacterized protein n=1 Tax=Zhongshania antarctica TaxID=641702 RepID=A0A840R836_9GAMM|nr:hypothetical protein [Zhongshania antarctica]
MSNDIIKFPNRFADRARLESQTGKLRCEVSERWIQFPSESIKLKSIEPLVLDIMTKGADENDRKICQIIVDKRQLLKILADLPCSEP